MVDGFAVQSSALGKLADILSDQARQLDAIHQSLADVLIPGGAFGALPASGQLHSEHTAHAQSELENLLLGRGLMQDDSEGLAATAARYDEAEHLVEASARAIQGSL